MVRAKEFIIHDGNYKDVVIASGRIVDGEKKGLGLVERDYSAHPQCEGKNARTLDMELIDPNEYVERIQEMEAAESGLHYLRRNCGPGKRRIPSLDQDGQGYCWMYSGTMCLMLIRALLGLPYVRLSGHYGASLIKNYRDEGGWGAQGLEFLIEHGQPSVEFWPEKSRDRKNDTPETRANALKHRVAEYYMDMTPPVYNRNLSERQCCTALLKLCAVIGDFNWWSHSVCIMALALTREARRKKSMLKTDFGSLDLDNTKDRAAYSAVFRKLMINSWTDSWGDNGESYLEGNRQFLNGGAAIRAASPNVLERYNKEHLEVLTALSS